MKYVLPFLLFCFCAFSQTNENIKNSFWDTDTPYFSISMVELPDGTLAGARVVIKGNEGQRGAFPAHTYKGTDGWITIDYGYGRPDRVIQFKVISRDSNAMVCELDSETKFPLLRQDRKLSFTLHKRKK